jgi:hypothetical protein
MAWYVLLEFEILYCLIILGISRRLEARFRDIVAERLHLGNAKMHELFE